jgi:hypothetical protein
VATISERKGAVVASEMEGGVRRRRRSLHGAAILLSVATLLAAPIVSRAADQSVAPDQAGPAIVPSSVSATVEFSLSALQGELERSVPKRLATFRNRTRSCRHRPFLGRTINIDCEYSGYVERTGPVSLQAQGGRLVATVPLYGTVSARGVNKHVEGPPIGSEVGPRQGFNIS